MITAVIWQVGWPTAGSGKRGRTFVRPDTCPVAIAQSAGTASAWNDFEERRISTDQRVKGDSCQSESDPATCFLGDLEDVAKYD